MLTFGKDDASIPADVALNLGDLARAVATRQHVIDCARVIKTRPYTLQGAIDTADAVLDGIASVEVLSTRLKVEARRVSREAELLADIPPVAC
jgi:hypothetical protein